MSTKRRWLGSLFALSLAFSLAAAAGEPAAPTNAELKKQIDELRALLDNKQKAAEKPEAAPEKKADSWTEKVKINGSLRLRFEEIEEQTKASRERGRFRMRLGAEAAANEEFTVGARLSTGDDDCPTGANQTMDNAFSKKDVWFELAYVDWHPLMLKGLGVENETHVIGGKMENPFFRPGGSELMWDGSVCPEGAAVTERCRLGPVEPFAIGGGFWVDERSENADAALYGGQLGLKLNFWEVTAKDGKKSYQAWATLGGGYYDFTNLKGYDGLYDPTKTFGNTFDANGHYLYDFNLVQGFVEAGVKVYGVPVVISGDSITNRQAPSGDNDAWLVGAAVGDAKEARSWRLSWDYRRLEPDSLLGVFTNGDTGGGGTNVKGHRFGLEYVIVKDVKAGVNYFLDEKNIARDDDETEYRRLQVELNVQF